jgi:hypothetical protein
MLTLQSLNIFIYNTLYRAGVRDPMNIALNFVINMGVSLFLTWVSSKTVTPLTSYTCKKVSALLWKKAE